MGDGSVAFADLGRAMDGMLIFLLAGLLAAIACWFACYGVYLAGAKVIAAGRRRRTEAAQRAEVVRGLTEIERFLEAHAAGAIPGESPDSFGGGPAS